jgi:hypothetical protein
VTPSTALAQGAATWYIQTYGAGGTGPWSSGKSFTVTIIPNIRGTYTGSGSVTNLSCTDPLDTGKTFPFTVNTMPITEQDGSGFFRGSASITTDENLTLNITGTVYASGQVTGTLYLVTPPPSGQLPFTGSLVGNQLTLSISGQTVYPSETCSVSGSMTVTR